MLLAWKYPHLFAASFVLMIASVFALSPRFPTNESPIARIAMVRATLFSKGSFASGISGVSAIREPYRERALPGNHERGTSGTMRSFSVLGEWHGHGRNANSANNPLISRNPD